MSNLPIYVYDPTATDEQSKVRGIGRYLQILKETFSSDITFTSDIKSIPKESLFINPFFTFFNKPFKIFRLAKKQVAVIHDLVPLKYPQHFPVGLKGKWYTFLNKWALNSYDLIVTDSLASKKDIMKILHVPEKKIVVIYPPVSKLFLPHLELAEESEGNHHPFHKEGDKSVAEFNEFPLAKFTEHEEIKNMKDYLLYVGDATWNKNLTNVAKAIKLANLPCVFVGKVFQNREEILQIPSKKLNPWQKPLQEFLKEAQNDPRFIFPGFISDIELLQLYKNARANVLISFDEGFGFSFLEAAYLSTPSILADVPIFHETAKDDALFADPNNPKAIGQKMVELYYDQVKREKLSVKAFERAQDFKQKNFKQAWEKVVTSL